MKLKDEEKENKIREVTLDLVSEKGIAGVKMATIAKMAGLSPSTLYVYYKSKEDLLKAVFRFVMRLFFQMDLDKEQRDTPYKARVEHLYKRILGFKQKNVRESHFMKQFATSPYYDQQLSAEMKDLSEGFIGLIQLGRDQLILKDQVDINVLVAVIDGMTEKLIAYQAKGKIELSESLINESFQVVWDGIKQ
ncbi:TetR/AcrR family transcriptional regulator [Xanthovirga aplysinae]|uniref:TetR/AcrR family transcriptional regulator n=1 Tax=Xanthovirga aplysinae TaxID=2529853 RepID=UPI0012BBA97B|nr:TetR/AcrR family transcriptional regulator [Xanthovirga aplysinae]MTI31335.1 TetR/AcrR family transcriptional regulator [Xanthovirga aplysinae]